MKRWLLVFVLAWSAVSLAAPEKVVVIRGVRLFDGKSDELVPRATVVIRGDRIASVEKGDLAEIPKDAEVWSLDGLTLLPGLIDLHTHILCGAPGGGTEPFEVAPGSWPAKLAGFLLSGVTSVRDLGDFPEDIFELRAREREGTLLSPRLFVVGPIFTAPGGHPNPMTVTIQVEPAKLETLACRVTDPAVARKKVRELKHADAIKIVFSGGPAMGGLPKLAEPCLVAIVEEAHACKLRVVVHTDSLDDAKTVLRAGADGLEHGVDLPGQSVDDELVSLLVAKGAFYVPTLAVQEAFTRQKDLNVLLDFPEVRRGVPATTLDLLRKGKGRMAAMAENPGFANLMRTRVTNAMANLAKVVEGHGRIALGTDAGNFVTFFGPSVHRELELMVRAGMTPAQALHAATRDAAIHLGRANDLGTIEPGKLADLIAVQGNPLEEVSVTRNVGFVMKGGTRLELAALEAVLNPKSR